MTPHGYPAGDNKPIEDWNPPPRGPGAGMPRSQPTDLIQALTRAFLEADGYDPDTEMADPHPAGIAAHYRTLAQVAVRTVEEAKDKEISAYREALTKLERLAVRCADSPRRAHVSNFTIIMTATEVLSRFDEGAEQ